MSSDEPKRKRWFPLESSPEVMNAYVEKMGFPTSEFSFCDVLSTEEWALVMAPSPVMAVILLYPIKPHVRKMRPFVLKQEWREILKLRYCVGMHYF